MVVKFVQTYQLLLASENARDHLVLKETEHQDEDESTKYIVFPYYNYLL